MSKVFQETIPEMEEVSPEHEALIAEFLQRQTAFYGSDTPHYLARAGGDERVLAYKFLTARKWSVEEAEKMFRGVIEMRKARNFDRMPLFPSPFPSRGYDPEKVNAALQLQPREENHMDRWSKLINPTFCTGFHKWDKQGHPILIERTGLSNVKELFNRFKSIAAVGKPVTHAAVEFQLFLNEVAGALVRYQDGVVRETNPSQRILGIVYIMDMKGLGYGHLWRPALELLKATFEVDATYYPEGLHRLYLVNCPTMILFAFNIVKGWIDPRVHQKINFVSPADTPSTLLRVIGENELPTFLGGKCECADAGGCAPMAPLDVAGNGTEGDTLTEEINVPAGKSFGKAFKMVKGEEVVWEFAAGEKDVNFTVSWFDDASEGERVVVDTTRLKDGSDTYVASSAGKLILTWDNTASWFTGKKLQMRVFKMAPAASAEDASSS